MNSKMTINSQLSTPESKKNKNKLSKQRQQEQNHRYGDQMEDYHGEWVQGVRERMGKKVQGLKSSIGRYKIYRGMLRKVQEMEKLKNLHARDPWI